MTRYQLDKLDDKLEVLIRLVEGKRPKCLGHFQQLTGGWQFATGLAALRIDDVREILRIFEEKATPSKQAPLTAADLPPTNETPTIPLRIMRAAIAASPGRMDIVFEEARFNKPFVIGKRSGERIAYVDHSQGISGEAGGWSLYFEDDFVSPTAFGKKTRGWPERAGAALGKAIVIGRDK